MFVTFVYRQQLNVNLSNFEHQLFPFLKDEILQHKQIE